MSLAAYIVLSTLIEIIFKATYTRHLPPYTNKIAILEDLNHKRGTYVKMLLTRSNNSQRHFILASDKKGTLKGMGATNPNLCACVCVCVYAEKKMIIVQGSTW